VGIKKGSSYLETGYSKTGWSGKVGGGVYGDCGGALRAAPALRAPRSFRAGTDHAAYAVYLRMKGVPYPDAERNGAIY